MTKPTLPSMIFGRKADGVMKIKWLIAGFFLGIIAAFALLYGGARVIMAHPNLLGRRGVMLSLGEMLLVQTKHGTALIDFTNYGKDGTTSFYRWRFKSLSGNETQGTGSVYENYERSQLAPNQYMVHDKGGHLHVVAGGVSLEWSYGSTNEGWLYYNKYRTKTQVMPDDNFQRVELK